MDIMIISVIFINMIIVLSLNAKILYSNINEIKDFKYIDDYHSQVKMILNEKFI